MLITLDGKVATCAFGASLRYDLLGGNHGPHATSRIARQKVETISRQIPGNVFDHFVSTATGKGQGQDECLLGLKDSPIVFLAVAGYLLLASAMLAVLTSKPSKV
ncbi:hypothetical protein [Synechococcus sp. MIT S1220]|uniref:hypothetical protein n=1 Tax=Synechococcus sp. MIT S1220 TaxID=3082549 RepID=UPI0039AF3776